MPCMNFVTDTINLNDIVWIFDCFLKKTLPEMEWTDLLLFKSQSNVQNIDQKSMMSSTRNNLDYSPQRYRDR